MSWNIEQSTEEIALLLESGVIYRDAGKLQEARDVFRGVRALRPSSEIPEVFLGTVDFQQARFDEAIEHYQKAIRINNRSAWAYAQLSEAQVFRGEIAAARITVKRALELDPHGEFGCFARTLLAFADQLSNPDTEASKEQPS